MTKLFKTLLIVLIVCVQLPSVFAAGDDEPEMVCVQDLNENGYAGEEGETAACISGIEKDTYFCPISAVACEDGEVIIAEPAVESCPAGYVQSADGDFCTKENYQQQQPTRSCPAGYSYNPSNGLCVRTTQTTSNPSISCPSGYTYNSSNSLCQQGTTVTSPPNYSCPNGFIFNAGTVQCTRNKVDSYMPQTNCPAGQTVQGARCVQTISETECMNNPSVSYCQFNQPSTWALVQGGGWTGYWDGSVIGGGAGNSVVRSGGAMYKLGGRAVGMPGGAFAHQICRCETFRDLGPAQQTCATGNLNTNTGRCEVTGTETTPVNINCGSGTYNSQTKMCETGSVVTTAPNYSCSSGTFNSNTKLCVTTHTDTTNQLISCPNNLSYNPYRGVCERTDVITIPVIRECPEGKTYRPSTKLCEEIVFQPICPIAGGGACVADPNSPFAAWGVYQTYCSPNPCMDLKDAEEVGNIDGTMLVDNGARDSDGQCLDELQIFTGRASYCQLSGKSTAFQNCCKNDGKVNSDSMGTVNELSLAIDTIQAMYEVTAAAYSAYSSTIAAGGSQAAASSAASTAASEAISALMNPATIAWAVVIYLVLDYLMQSCDAMSMETSMNAESGFCHYVGEYCKTKWLGHCVQKARGFCCFNSMMGRIIHEQGRPQLNTFNDWGTPDSPDCRGFDPDEFRDLDFSKIDFSEYYAELLYKTQGQVTDTMTKLTEQFYDRTH